MNISRLVLVLSGIALAGCASNNSLNPVPDVDDVSWSAYLLDSGLVGESKPAGEWWKAFNDSQLNQLIEQTLSDGFDVNIARSRIREARFSHRLELAPTKPSLDLGGSVNRQRLSETGSLPVGRVPGFERDQTVYDVAFDAGWELDVFGRNTQRSIIAQSRYQSQLEHQQDTVVQLIAELMRTYFEYRSLETQRSILDRNVIYQQQEVDLTREKWQLGESSEVEFEDARAALLTTEQQLVAINARKHDTVNRLALLVGGRPRVVTLATDNAYLPPAPVAISSLSSDVLRRRPDVRNAERAYVIAASEFRLSELAVLPTFSLFASAGPNSIDLDRLGDSESLALNLAGLVHWPVYSGGALRAHKGVANERLYQAEQTFKKTVLAALYDVESKASALLAAQENYRKQQLILESIQVLAMAELDRYQAGVIGLRRLIKAQRRLAEVELGLTRDYQSWIVNRIAMHKAINGDWGVSLLDDSSVKTVGVKPDRGANNSD